MIIIKMLPLIFLLTSCSGWQYTESNNSDYVYENENVYNDDEEVCTDCNEENDLSELNDDDQDQFKEYISDDELFKDENKVIFNGISKISVGENLAAAIINEKVYSWGEWINRSYSLSAVKTNLAPIEMDFKELIDQEKPVSVDAGRDHACALFDNGRLFCWGSNYYGQLGNSTNLYSFLPKEIDMSNELKGKKVISVTCGVYHTCVIADDLNVYCWGYNGTQQLGTGDNTNLLSPRKVNSETLDNSEIVQIDAGSGFTCAVDSLGKLYCWGHLSLGYSIDSGVPSEVGSYFGLDKRMVTQVSCGSDSLCVLDSKYRMFCMGHDNDNYKLGVRTLENDIHFAEVLREGDFRLVKPEKLTTGEDFSCIIDRFDATYCWGLGSQCNFGEKFLYSNLPVLTPKNATVPGKIVDISAGVLTVCVLDDLGGVYCRGSNMSATLGNGTDMDSSCTQIKTAEDLSIRNKVVTALDVKNHSTCVVTKDKTLHCWGENAGSHNFGEYPYSYSVPVNLRSEGFEFAQDVNKVSQGSSHSCYLNDEGNIFCWGENLKGQLGNDSFEKSFKPVKVQDSGVLNGKEVVEISLGSNHSCALDVDGSVYCWGFNYFGQLGDGTFTNSSVPVKVFDSGVLSGQKVVQISLGGSSTCVLTQTGSVFCWGINETGQLGNGEIDDSNVPVKVDDTGVLAGKVLKAIDVFSGHACALDEAGVIYCWGDNSNGQLGNGTKESSLVPMEVVYDEIPENKKAKLVSVGWSHTCSVYEDNELYCWGLLSYGDNSSKDKIFLNPTKHDKGEAVETVISQIDAGSFYTCLKDVQGAVYCWGRNSSGELGDSTLDDKDLPVRVY